MVFTKKSVFIAIGISILISLVVCGIDILTSYLAVSEYGTRGMMDGSFVLEMISIFLAIYLILISLIGIIFKQIRIISSLILIASFIFIPLTWTGLRLGTKAYIYAFKRVAIQSRPLISAIQSYDKKYGHPPEKLQDLVPEFMNKIPRTGIADNPNYEYRVLSYGVNEVDHWKLSIKPPRNDYDIFFYYPSEQYYIKDITGRNKKIEGWAYIFGKD